MLPKLQNSFKLITKEDPFHIHKTIGGLTLVHFMIRFYYLCTSLDYSLGFDPTNKWTHGWILLHMALSGTSLFFHIPNNRVKMAPMIWPEFRLHSILFAYRSLIVLWFHWYVPSWTYIRPIVVYLTLFLADCVSNHYKKIGYLENQTTMRSMPFPSYIPPSLIQFINLFYSVSQVFATMNVLYGSPEAIFITLFPIQLAAFWMTLVRKGILTSGQWHLYYGGSLLSNFIYALYHPNNVPFLKNPYYILSGIGFGIGRFYYKMDKYFLWSMVLYMNRLVNMIE